MPFRSPRGWRRWRVEVVGRRAGAALRSSGPARGMIRDAMAWGPPRLGQRVGTGAEVGVSAFYIVPEAIYRAGNLVVVVLEEADLVEFWGVGVALASRSGIADPICRLRSPKRALVDEFAPARGFHKPPPMAQ